MRLICPNCDAQYEVDAAMIPASGRDVQCSNCGTTWFQEPAGSVKMAPAEVPAEQSSPAQEAGPPSGDGLGPEAAEFFGERKEPEEAQPVAAEAEVEQAPAEAAPPEEAPAEVADEIAPEAAEIPEPEEHPEEAAGEAEPGPAAEEAADRAEAGAPPEREEEAPAPEEAASEELPRRPIDPKVLGILRAEAEREIAARRAEEARAMEVQGDLGLSEPAARRERSEAEIRTARLRGEDEAQGAAEGHREVLPDIDDINASLTATSDREAPLPDTEARQVAKRRSGFRTGFFTVLLVIAAVILVYLYAPQIAAAVPALEPALAAFVEWANGMRLGIDSLLTEALAAMSGGEGG